MTRWTRAGVCVFPHLGLVRAGGSSEATKRRRRESRPDLSGLARSDRGRTGDDTVVVETADLAAAQAEHAGEDLVGVLPEATSRSALKNASGAPGIR